MKIEDDREGLPRRGGIRSGGIDEVAALLLLVDKGFHLSQRREGQAGEEEKADQDFHGAHSKNGRSTQHKKQAVKAR
jgi:hypothetical protein